ncbi:MAG: ankyrin repeat domain-containing protein [Bryobacteraceae bacterium]
MSATDDLLGSFEVHSPEGIRKALDDGASPTEPIRGKKPIYWLIEMYTRSRRFAECVRVMLKSGSVTDDPLLDAVLLDEDASLHRILKSSREDLKRKLYLDCAYTSLKGVSALHVCAEYNSVRCARTLLETGVDVNIRADVDGEGIGGQTPLFHAVNSNHNHCRPMMELMVKAGADLDVRLKGLVWGAGFEWETVVFDVTPLSYAQCGLYAQFHRREGDVYRNIAYLYQRRYGSEPQIRNVPNKYLQDDRVFPPRI